MDVALWIASTHQETYGRCLRRLARLFAAEGGPAADGITLDPARFTLAAWQAATGPLGEPDYLGHHPRVLHADCHRAAGAPHLVAVVDLALLPPSLPSGWRSWQQPDYRAPKDGTQTPTALGRLELRIPIDAAELPTPTHPQAPGLPNLMDAQVAVEAVLAHINQAVAPFLRSDAPPA